MEIGSENKCVNKCKAWRLTFHISPLPFIRSLSFMRKNDLHPFFFFTHSLTSHSHLTLSYFQDAQATLPKLPFMPADLFKKNPENHGIFLHL